jgi:hypothetical protein
MTTDSCMHILQISSLLRFLENDTERPERGLLMGNTLAATAMQKSVPITAMRIIMRELGSKISTNRHHLIRHLENEGRNAKNKR